MMRAALLLLSGLMLWGSVQAQSYPSRPLTLVVAFAPGGTGDIVARLVAKKMAEGLGQPVLVENRPIPVAAVAAVAQAKPDGHTLIMAGSGTALTSALYERLPYDLMKDFSHVSTLASFDLALLVDAGSPFHSVADIQAYARAHPGKLTIAAVRVGSTQNGAAEMFKAVAGIDAVIVPFKSAGEITSALRAGDAQVAIELLPAVLGPLNNKTLRALAVGGAQRNPALPQVPTLAESGLAGYEAASWNGIAVPAATPPAMVERLAREIARAVPAVQKELLALGVTPQASPQMRERMRADIAKWRGVIDKAGIPRQ